MGFSNFSSAEDNRPRFGAEALLYLVSIAAVFMFSGTRALFGSENRWAEAVREMLTNGDIFHPCLNGVVYFDKPILSYWLIYGSARLFGGLDEWVLRLPSALFALVAVWAMVRLGRKLFGQAEGILGGWLLISCYGFLWWSRSAEADIENTAVILLAVVWFLHCRDHAGFRHYLLFYLIIFIGALFKGLPAVVVPLLAAGAFTLTGGREAIFRQLNWRQLPALAIGAGAFFGILYFVNTRPLAQGCMWPSGQLSALELVWRENIVRAFAAFDHEGGLFIYTYELPRLLLPWSPFFVLALGWSVLRWKTLSAVERGLVLTVVLIFAAFTASESRRWYYILPIAPFALMLTARWLMVCGCRQKWMTLICSAIRLVGTVAASLAVLSLLGWSLWPRLFGFEPPVALLLSVPAAGLIMLAVLVWDERGRASLSARFGLPDKFCAPLLVCAIASITAISAVVPATDAFRTTRPFLYQLRGELDRVLDERVIMYAPEANCEVLYYLNFPAPMTVVVSAKDPVAGAAALCDELRDLAVYDGTIYLLSYPRYFNKLAGQRLPGLPEARFAHGDLEEPLLRYNDSDSKKLRIWKIEPSEIRKYFENEKGANQ
ncbi:MAG: ArnT family glycosyltransferase [Victivallaceae bacterium]